MAIWVTPQFKRSEVDAAGATLAAAPYLMGHEYWSEKDDEKLDQALDVIANWRASAIITLT